MCVGVFMVYWHWARTVRTIIKAALVGLDWIGGLMKLSLYI